MNRDIRDTPIFKDAEALANRLRRPGSGRPSDGFDISTSADGTKAVFAAAMMDSLEGLPATRIARIDLGSGDLRILTYGPNIDRLPRYSPTDDLASFLSDRGASGDFQLHLLDLASSETRACPRVDGWVEAQQWSPDGQKILLLVAGHGADVAGGQGAVTSIRRDGEAEDWMPSVEAGEEAFQWRRVWIYDLATNAVARVGPSDSNIWEAAWCGNDALALVTSPSPDEGRWYSAQLIVWDLERQASIAEHRPIAQIGLPAGSPDGRHLAFVEAVCSDRGIVAGDAWLLDLKSGKKRPIDTAGVDVTHLEWRSTTALLIAGQRSFETVVGLHELTGQNFRETWSSCELSSVGRYAMVSGFGKDGDFAILAEGFLEAPSVAVVVGGDYRRVCTLGAQFEDYIKDVLARAEQVRWTAPDGLEIEGWLLLPHGVAPFPMVMNIHGGPVWQTRPTWLGRWGLFMLLLLERGTAVFMPNPRGSSGRGTEFIAKVVGDLGGAETADLLSGIDHLVERGIADPDRLGVTGVSHGGFMTSWIITQTDRFRAAVPVAQVANHVTEHLIGNIPSFVSTFLQDHYANPGGRYHSRSPVMHVAKVSTPTLNISGALDRCTPPEEAVQFHRALKEQGVHSVLVTYPLEGHGVRHYPAALDFAARVVAWFDDHFGTHQK